MLNHIAQLAWDALAWGLWIALGMAACVTLYGFCQGVGLAEQQPPHVFDSEDDKTR